MIDIYSQSMSGTEVVMKFRTESGSQYDLQLASNDIDPQLYRVTRTDKNGEQSEFTATVMTRIPFEIGSRVLFTVFEGDRPSMLMTTRVLPDLRMVDQQIA